MLAEINNSIISGCKEITPKRFADIRGSLTKVYAADFFEENNMPFKLEEEFFTLSHKNVIRAMHFQLPPHEQTKIVFCIQGAILDVLLDLRSGSPTYGRHETFVLSADKCNSLYIPAGIAHGYLVKDGPSIVVYKTSSLFHADLDSGVAWDSCGIDWGIENPIIADKDKNLPALNSFKSPFNYEVEI